MGIVRFALRLPYTFYVVAMLVAFLGSTAILSMPTDIFPEIKVSAGVAAGDNVILNPQVALAEGRTVTATSSNAARPARS
jgi:hypothetical protein